MKTKIKVTQDHIDAADFLRDKVLGLSSSCKCPIALAAAHAGFPDSLVGQQYLYPFESKNGILHGVPLPKKAQEFVAAFDNHKRVKPFSFEIDIP